MQRMQNRIWCAFFVLCYYTFVIAAHKVKISNTEVRQDVNGLAMDTHDGSIMQWTEEGPYYFYALGYQNCTIEHGKIPPQECPGIYRPYGDCGFRVDHSVRLYTSPDLVEWTMISEDIFPYDSRPYGIYFRPKVILHRESDTYLLWINYLPNATIPLESYPDAMYIVASSKTPEGPFLVTTENVAIEQSGAGDFSILVDETVTPNTAYLAYDSWGTNHQIVVEQLTADFTNSLGAAASSGTLTPENNEAPILFQRKGWYYLLYGHTCCFCKEGAGAAVLSASNPLGPWHAMDIELNPRVHESLNHSIQSQNSFVFQAPLADDTVAYVFAGDLWSTAADGLKSHDLQYWEALQFDDSVKPPTITPSKGKEFLELDLV